MAEISNIAKLPELTPKFWMFVGGEVKKWVERDCREGLMQDDAFKLPLSPKYKKYKDHDMRRFSDGKRLGDVTSGGRMLRQRRFPLVGRALQTIGTPYVTMMLTGDTVRGLKPTKPTKNGVTMAFNEADSPKIYGNQQIRYNIVGLNRVNRELVRQEIIKEFNRNKVKFLKKDVKIGVRF